LGFKGWFLMTMQGAWRVKSFVNDYLKTDFPDRLRIYRNEWNLDDESLPEPVEYLTWEPIAIDAWPTLITVALSMSGLERIDFNSLTDPIYGVNYSMRTYVWVRDDSPELCTAKRDRITTVLRSSILDNQCLGVYSQEDNLEVQVDEGSIREEYSDLTLLKGERVMAGAYIAYNVRITEVVKVNPVGVLNELSVEENLLLPLLVDLQR
jgi:hypothetical protein